MSFTTSLWCVEEDRLKEVSRSALADERQLEDWLAADPSLLGRDLLIFGRQTRTHSGPLDLLAIDGDGGVVIIELKRHRTPRDVVAQVLDYASWIRRLEYDQFDQICLEYLGKPLAQAFREHFQYAIPETAGTQHSTLIVASELDDSSERIVEYLQEEHDININAVYFTTFELNGQKLLARSWLADPERIEVKPNHPWSGLWFVNNGVDENSGRNWEACTQHDFISAGGDRKYSDPLRKLDVGDKIVAYQSKFGYVGYGTVTQKAIPASEFRTKDGKSIYAVLPAESAPKFDRHRDDPDRCEYAVRILWQSKVPADQAKWFTGAFAKPHVVCRLRDEATGEFLKREFSIPVDQQKAT